MVAGWGPEGSSSRRSATEHAAEGSVAAEPEASGQHRWKGEALSGLPVTARVWDVAAAETERLVAVGTVADADCSAVPLVVWTSDDGLAWEEAFRTREGFGAGGSFCGEVLDPAGSDLGRRGSRWGSRPDGRDGAGGRPGGGSTPAALAARPLWQTGRHSLVLGRGYISRGPLFRDSAAAQVGL